MFIMSTLINYRYIKTNLFSCLLTSTLLCIPRYAYTLILFKYYVFQFFIITQKPEQPILKNLEGTRKIMIN